MMNRQRADIGLILVIMTFSFLISGCAVMPTRSGFLSDYSAMQNQYGLDQVRVTEGTDLSRYDKIVFKPVTRKFLSPAEGLHEQEVDEIVKNLQQNMLAELTKHFRSAEIAQDGRVSDQNAVIMELAVTELTPTNVMANVIVNFGVGNATAGMEGTIVEASTGKELVAFADRKKGDPFAKQVRGVTNFPNWSRLQYLYAFTEIWPERIGKMLTALGAEA